MGPQAAPLPRPVYSGLELLVIEQAEQSGRGRVGQGAHTMRELGVAGSLLGAGLKVAMPIHAPVPCRCVLALCVAGYRVTLDPPVMGVGSCLTIGCLKPGLEQRHTGLLQGSGPRGCVPASVPVLACGLLAPAGEEDVLHQLRRVRREAHRVRRPSEELDEVGGRGRVVTARPHQGAEEVLHGCKSTPAGALMQIRILTCGLPVLRLEAGLTPGRGEAFDANGRSPKCLLVASAAASDVVNKGPLLSGGQNALNGRY